MDGSSGSGSSSVELQSMSDAIGHEQAGRVPGVIGGGEGGSLREQPAHADFM